MIFTIQTNDEVSGLDITNLLNFAHIEHTILSKQHDEAAKQSVQRIGYQTAVIPCPHCGVNIYTDSDIFIANR